MGHPNLSQSSTRRRARESRAIDRTIRHKYSGLWGLRALIRVQTALADGCLHPGGPASRTGVLLPLFAIAAILPMHPAPACAQNPLASARVGSDYRVIVEDSNPAIRPPSGQDRSLHLRRQSIAPRLADSSTRPETDDWICATYTFRVGWRSPMDLYLGQGSETRLSLVKEAVAAWNGLLAKTLINLHETPTASALHASHPNEEGASDYYNDGRSLIYFSAPGPSGQFGYTLSRHSIQNEKLYEITESDIFVWVPDGGISDTDLLIAIQHEIGHAIGLDHIPISGNIMSHDYRPAIEHALLPFVFLDLVPDYDDAGLDADELNIFEDPEYADLLRILVRPRAQDKTAAMCLYPFNKWGQR